MLIRVEISVDTLQIDRLLRTVFQRDIEANLVRQLREDGLITLGLVAVNNKGIIVGYAAFSPVTVNNQDRCWVGLAPLAVAADWQGKGIGTQLINEGLTTLNEFGYKAVVALGEPGFYQTSGFVLAKQYNLNCTWQNSENYFHIYLLNDEKKEEIAGVVEYSSIFHQIIS